jgi:hypothetical protein
MKEESVFKDDRNYMLNLKRDPNGRKSEFIYPAVKLRALGQFTLDLGEKWTTSNPTSNIISNKIHNIPQSP